MFYRPSTRSSTRATNLKKVTSTLLSLLALIGSLIAGWLGWSDSEPIKRKEVFEGRVVSVTDGDTLVVLTKLQERKIRLANIDAPESEQDYGSRARISLAGLCFGKHASVEVQDIDRYERVVGVVTCGDTEANTEQVRRGLAWVYDNYNKDKDLKPIEAQAKRDKQGLWAKRNPTPPWEWRRERRG